MAEYYAVERTPEYLMHYGIKGMRWGVRKAKESGNDAALARHFGRAQRKLAKLRSRADVSRQKKLYDYHKKLAIADALGGATAVGMGYGATALSRNAAMNRLMKKAAASAGVPGVHVNIEKFDDYRPAAIGTGASLGAFAIGRGIAAGVAKSRTTKKGHEKAVKKMNDWQKEMNKAFSGTKYAKGKNEKLSKAYKNMYDFTYKNEESSRVPGLIFGPIGAGIASAHHIYTHPKEYDQFKKSVKRINRK